MVSVRWAFVLLVMLVPSVAAHVYSEHGTMAASSLGRESESALRPVIALVESIAAGTLPNGILWYAVHGVQAGDTFTVTADDGQEPWLPGHHDCPPDEGDLVGLVGCGLGPDFDVWFSGHSFANGWGDEAGTVPGDGSAYVVLFLGDVGEGFTYSEG